MTKLSLLLQLGNSNKKVHEDRDHLVYIIEEELDKVGRNGILAYFSCERGHRSVTKDVYILQQWDSKWETYVGATDLEQVEDRDRLTVIRQEDTSSSSATGFDLVQSGFDRVQSQVSLIVHVNT